MVRKFLMLIFSTLAIIAIGIVTAEATDAISITTDLVADRYATDNTTAIKYLQQGESFSYTFTVQNAVGTVYWHIMAWDEGERGNDANYLNNLNSRQIGINENYTVSSPEGFNAMEFIPDSGNSLTVKGTFNSSFVYILGINVTDERLFNKETAQEGTTQYDVWFQDSSYNSGGGGGTNPSPTPPPETTLPLPHVMIEAVPDEVLSYVSESGDTVLKRIARLASINVEQINVITSLDLDLSLPHEPTEAMKKKAKDANLEIIAKIDTLTPRSETLQDGQPGYFLFQLNIPDEILSMDLKVKDLELWYASPDELNASVKGSIRAAFDPFTYFEITDMLGFEADTLGKKMLVLIFANAGESLSMWLLKTILMILMGGCSSLTFAGIGLMSLLCAGGVIATRKRFMR